MYDGMMAKWTAGVQGKDCVQGKVVLLETDLVVGLTRRDSLYEDCQVGDDEDGSWAITNITETTGPERECDGVKGCRRVW